MLNKYLIALLLLAVNVAAQTHTTVTREDAQTITGAKTFSGNNIFTGSAPITVSGDNPTVLGGSLTSKRFSGIRHPAIFNASDFSAGVNSAVADFSGPPCGQMYGARGSYSTATSINFDGLIGCALLGAGGQSGGAATPTIITYTSTGTPLSIRSSIGAKIDGLYLSWTNAGFIGPPLDASHSTASDSSYLRVSNSTFQANGSGAKPNCALNLDKTINSQIDNVNLSGYVNGICGAADNTSYSNANILSRVNFSSSTGTASGCHILNPAQAYTGVSLTFEQGSAAGQPKLVCFTGGASALGLAMLGWWSGDATAGSTQTYLPLVGGGFLVGSGYHAGTTGTTFLSLSNSSDGLAVVGAKITTHATGYAFGANNSNVFICGNSYTAITTFMTGTPTSGIVCDNAGNVKFYGPVIASSTVTAAGVTASGTSLVTLGSTVVGSLPSAASNTFAQVGVTDSTAVAAEGQTCVGGSSNKAIAISNGTIWKCF